MLWLVPVALAEPDALADLVKSLTPEAAREVERVTEMGVGPLPNVVLTTRSEERLHLLEHLDTVGLTEEQAEFAVQTLTAMYTPNDHTIRLFMDRITRNEGWALERLRPDMLRCILGHELAHAQQEHHGLDDPTVGSWLLREGHAQWVEREVCRSSPEAAHYVTHSIPLVSRSRGDLRKTWEASECVRWTMDRFGPQATVELLESDQEHVRRCEEMLPTMPLPGRIHWPPNRLLAAVDPNASDGALEPSMLEGLPVGSRMVGARHVEGDGWTLDALFLDEPVAHVASSPFWSPARDLVPEHYLGDLYLGWADDALWGIWPHHGLIRLTAENHDAALARLESLVDTSTPPAARGTPPLVFVLMLATDTEPPYPDDLLFAVEYPVHLVGPGFALSPDEAREPAYPGLRNEPIVHRAEATFSDFWSMGESACRLLPCKPKWMLVRDLPVGHVLTHEDIHLVSSPEYIVPPDALGLGDDPIGQRLSRASGAGMHVRLGRLAELRKMRGWEVFWDPADTPALQWAPPVEKRVITDLVESQLPAVRDAVEGVLGRSIGDVDVEVRDFRDAAWRPITTVLSSGHFAFDWEALVERHPHLFHEFPAHREALVQCTLARVLARQGTTELKRRLAVDPIVRESIIHEVAREACGDATAMAWLHASDRTPPALQAAVRDGFEVPLRKRLKQWSRIEVPPPEPAPEPWPSDAALLEVCSDLGHRGMTIRSASIGRDARTVKRLEHLAEVARIAKTRELVCGGVRIEAIDFYTAAPFPW